MQIGRSRVRTSVEWSASLCDLYDFALKHSSDIHVKGEHITIADNGVRDQFNKKQEASMALLQRVQALDRAFEAEKQQTVKRFGLTEQKKNPETQIHMIFESQIGPRMVPKHHRPQQGLEAGSEGCRGPDRTRYLRRRGYRRLAKVR